MSDTKKILALVLCLLILLAAPTQSHAQTNSIADQQLESLLSPVIDLSAEPSTPKPGETVTLSLKSFSTSLLRANIVWYIDGVLTKNGIGNTKITTQAKTKLGAGTAVRANITTEDGYTVEKMLSFVTQDLDLVIEPSGYTPPFYRGKSLYVPQGTGVIAAIPQFVNSNGTRISTKDIVYVWKKGGRVVSDTSGVGADRFNFSGSIPVRPIEIELEASTKSGDIKLSRSVYLESTNPSLVFYENNPAYGILFNKSLYGEKELTGEEINIFAAPFHMTTPAANSFVMTYDWYMNGGKIETPLGQNSLVLRNSGKEGVATISADIKNRGRIFQSSSGNFKVRFGKIDKPNNKDTNNTF